MLSYIYSWFYSTEESPVYRTEVSPVYTTEYHEFKPIMPFSESDLSNLKNVIPGPARNMPNIDKCTLEILSKAHIQDILAVKLKKTDVKPKQTYYEPRHPVLRELLLKTPKIQDAYRFV